MIVKLHGTSGSGKSTVARHLLNQSVIKPTEITNERGKIVAYECHIPNMLFPLYILGPYKTACGGCDALLAAEQIELLHRYAKLGHVFYEGLLASEYYGKLGIASEPYAKNHVFAFLTTPIEVCIERVKARRAAKGNEKPLDETNTRGRVRKIDMLRKKLRIMGREVVLIDHEKAGEEVLNIYLGAEHGDEPRAA